MSDSQLPLRSLVSDWHATTPIPGRFLDDRWRGAVQVLTEELPSDVFRDLHERIENDPTGWYSPLHFSFGMGVRNLLRSKGYDDSVFGCNLDDVCAPIIRDAVQHVILGPIAIGNNVSWNISWDNGRAKVEFCVTDHLGLIRTENDIPALLSTYLDQRALAFAHQITELEDLIASKATKESDLQRFFELYPHFLLGLEYVSLYPQVILEYEHGNLIPDFFLEPVSRQMWDILDIKTARDDIVVGRKNRRRLSSAVMDGVAQLREYGQYFDDSSNRRKVMERYGFFAYRPKLSLLIGRTPLEQDQLLVKRIMDDTSVKIVTYDDLLAIARNQLAYLSKSL